MTRTNRFPTTVGLVLGVVTTASLATVPSAAAAAATSAVFTYTGAAQTWTVPAGVTSVVAYVQGAQGGGDYGGFGGGVRATLAVTPGDQLQVDVGGRGAPGVGGFNGGGGSAFGTGSIGTGQGGGGASDIRTTATSGETRLLVAGGGGGGAGGPVFGMGGSAGKEAAESGENGDRVHTGGGGGGEVPGTAGDSFAGAAAGGTGGNGGFTAGGGGGGWFGGGGGGGDSSGGSPAGGGAGSSHAAPTATAVTFVQGARTGDGQVELTWAGAAFSEPPVTPGSFSYTGGPQVYRVPNGVTTVNAEVVGGQGGAGGTARPGFGADVKATIPVTPGQVLAVLVGGKGGPGEGCGALSCGDPGPGNSIGGFNGGASSNFAGAGAGRGSGGGGATDVRPGSWRTGTRAVVAGGGGGAAINGAGTAEGRGQGGDASGPTGGDGAAGDGIHKGGGGGQPAAAGKNGGAFAGDGAGGQGGAGGFSAGSGGGGWFGGGGGGGDSSGGSPGGGGAGSSFVVASATNPVFAASANLGEGFAIVGPGAGTTTPTSPTTPTTPTTPPGTAPPTGAPVKVTAPSVRVVRYIHSFAMINCANSIRQKFGNLSLPSALVTCAIINSTHNGVPGANIAASDRQWAAFLGRGDFRVAASLPEVTATCQGGRVAALSPLSGATRRFGYTPFRRVVGVPATGTLYHAPADPYQGDDGRWNTGSPAVTFAPDGSSVSLEFPVAVAASYAESKGNTLLLGVDLPFVWFDLKETLRCGGEVSTEILYSDTPSLSVYRGGVQVFADRQTTDWGSFFKSGRQGLTRYDPGQGNLDPACHTVTFAPGSNAGQRSTCAGPPL